MRIERHEASASSGASDVVTACASGAKMFGSSWTQRYASVSGEWL